jgi:hypothetical protein
MRKYVLPVLLALSVLGLSFGANAERFFPTNAKRGEMKGIAYPYMKIGDKTLRLAAGSRIYNEQNLIIMPASLQKQSAQIIYSADINGHIGAVWLLTAAEIKKYPYKATSKHVTNPTGGDEGRK